MKDHLAFTWHGFAPMVGLKDTFRFEQEVNIWPINDFDFLIYFV